MVRILGRFNYLVIYYSIILIIITISTPKTILQISKVRILLVTYLLFILEQQIKFLTNSNILSLYRIIFSFIRIISYLIQELISLLFINDLLIKINSFIQVRLSSIYLIPLSRYSQYYFNLLLSSLISSTIGSQYYIVINRLYEASN